MNILPRLSFAIIVLHEEYYNLTWYDRLKDMVNHQFLPLDKAI